MAHDLLGLGGVVARQAPRHFAPGGIEHQHRVALAEAALDLAHPGGEQGFAGLQRRHRPGVDGQGALRRQGPGDPRFVGRRRAQRRLDQGGQGAVLDRLQWRGTLAEGDQGGAAGALGDARGGQLGGHAPRAHSGLGVGPAGHGLDLVGQVGHHRHVAGGGVLPRIGGVETVDVRQQHQQVGADHLGHAGGQAVVVAVADFLGGDRVVLVDHRRDAERQQGLHGGAGVQPAAPRLGVVAGQQHLGRLEAVGFEGLFPGAHEQALAGGGGGLFLGQFQRTPAQAEAAPA